MNLGLRLSKIILSLALVAVLYCVEWCFESICFILFCIWTSKPEMLFNGYSALALLGVCSVERNTFYFILLFLVWAGCLVGDIFKDNSVSSSGGHFA